MPKSVITHHVYTPGPAAAVKRRSSWRDACRRLYDKGPRWRVEIIVGLLLLTLVTFGAGYLQKAACYQDGYYNGSTQYIRMCYSDLAYLYTERGFAESSWPYTGDASLRERYPEVMEYPVGISYWAWGTAQLTHAITHPDVPDRATLTRDELRARDDVRREIPVYTMINAIGLGIVTLLTAWFLIKACRKKPWEMVGFALAPTLALTALINWDLLAVACVAGALWAWQSARFSSRYSRYWLVLMGVMIGLGTAIKLYPVFLLGALLVICMRRGRMQAFVLVTLAACLTWLGMNLPAMLSSMSDWLYFWSFNGARGADLGSLWLMLSQMTGGMSLELVNKLSFALFAVWCVGVLWLGLKSPQKPRFAELGYLIVVGFLIFNKVYSPQYVLWLLPLAVLAVPRLRDILIWQAGEIVYFACVWWYLGGYIAGSMPIFYWTAILIRIAAELYLVWRIIQRFYRSPRR